MVEYTQITESETEESRVFNRDVYANKDFWNDRFAEQTGFFDWYAQWAEMKGIFNSFFPHKDHLDDSLLMVGCGNSKLSEEMSLDGYSRITNIDISSNVIEKMHAIYSTKFAMQEFLIFDATRMAYRDNSFDICIDKGTFDALACGNDIEVPMRLLSEMMRVCRTATVIVTSGTPEKRMHYFEKVCSRTIEYKQIEVSKLAQLINILRTELKGKPLADAMKDDHKVFKEAMHELAAIERIKRLEAEAKTNPKVKLALMMYKAKRMMEQKEKQANNTISDQEVQNKLYNPKRQEFVMIYVLRK